MGIILACDIACYEDHQRGRAHSSAGGRGLSDRRAQIDASMWMRALPLREREIVSSTVLAARPSVCRIRAIYGVLPCVQINYRLRDSHQRRSHPETSGCQIAVFVNFYITDEVINIGWISNMRTSSFQSEMRTMRGLSHRLASESCSARLTGVRSDAAEPHLCLS